MWLGWLEGRARGGPAPAAQEGGAAAGRGLEVAAVDGVTHLPVRGGAVEDPPQSQMADNVQGGSSAVEGVQVQSWGASLQERG